MRLVGCKVGYSDEDEDEDEDEEVEGTDGTEFCALFRFSFLVSCFLFLVYEDSHVDRQTVVLSDCTRSYTPSSKIHLADCLCLPHSTLRFITCFISVD